MNLRLCFDPRIQVAHVVEPASAVQLPGQDLGRAGVEGPDREPEVQGRGLAGHAAGGHGRSSSAASDSVSPDSKSSHDERHDSNPGPPGSP